MVECAKLGRTLPGLEQPPFPGPLGDRIYREVSQEAWDMWQEHQATVVETLVTEYPLQPNDPDIQEYLRREMIPYFWGEGARALDAWVPDPKEGVRMVECVKLGHTLPGLPEPPFPGPLGDRIYHEVSELAWNVWKEHLSMLMNNYSLNPGDPAVRKMLREEMEEFFFSERARVPEGWIPTGPEGWVEDTERTAAEHSHEDGELGFCEKHAPGWDSGEDDADESALPGMPGSPGMGGFGTPNWGSQNTPGLAGPGMPGMGGKPRQN
jgi:Fe-S cluster biosynthesis and repair protein YggX